MAVILFICLRDVRGGGAGVCPVPYLTGDELGMTGEHKEKEKKVASTFVKQAVKDTHPKTLFGAISTVSVGIV